MGIVSDSKPVLDSWFMKCIGIFALIGSLLFMMLFYSHLPTEPWLMEKEYLGVLFGWAYGGWTIIIMQRLGVFRAPYRFPWEDETDG